MASWDINKVSLCYWFDFYDMVYEHIERPPDRVLRSIGELDRWVKYQISKAEKERLEYLNKSGDKHPTSHQNVILFD